MSFESLLSPLFFGWSYQEIALLWLSCVIVIFMFLLTGIFKGKTILIRVLCGFLYIGISFISLVVVSKTSSSLDECRTISGTVDFLLDQHPDLPKMKVPEQDIKGYYCRTRTVGNDWSGWKLEKILLE